MTDEYNLERTNFTVLAMMINGLVYCRMEFEGTVITFLHPAPEEANGGVLRGNKSHCRRQLAPYSPRRSKCPLK